MYVALFRTGCQRNGEKWDEELGRSMSSVKWIMIEGEMSVAREGGCGRRGLGSIDGSDYWCALEKAESS